MLGCSQASRAAEAAARRAAAELDVLIGAPPACSASPCMGAKGEGETSALERAEGADRASVAAAGGIAARAWAAWERGEAPLAKRAEEQCRAAAAEPREAAAVVARRPEAADTYKHVRHAAGQEDKVLSRKQEPLDGETYGEPDGDPRREARFAESFPKRFAAIERVLAARSRNMNNGGDGGGVGARRAARRKVRAIVGATSSEALGLAASLERVAASPKGAPAVRKRRRDANPKPSSSRASSADASEVAGEGGNLMVRRSLDGLYKQLRACTEAHRDRASRQALAKAGTGYFECSSAGIAVQFARVMQVRSSAEVDAAEAEARQARAAATIQAFVRGWRARRCARRLRAERAAAAARERAFFADALLSWREWAAMRCEFRQRVARRRATFGLWRHLHVGRSFDGSAAMEAEGTSGLVREYLRWRTLGVVLSRWADVAAAARPNVDPGQ